MRILLVALQLATLTTFATLATTGCHDGGCFKKASAVTANPAEPCLELWIGSPGDSTICGDPQLGVTNHCADPFTLPAPPSGSHPGEQVTVAPGAQTIYPVPGYTTDRGAHYDVPAMLGSTALTISFTTSDL